MRRALRNFVIMAIAMLAGAILSGAVNAPGIAKGEQRIAIVTNSGKKGDRLPITLTAHAAKALPFKAVQSAGKRPPFGCDPMFSPIADPAQAGLYRRCAA